MTPARATAADRAAATPATADPAAAPPSDAGRGRHSRDPITHRNTHAERRPQDPEKRETIHAERRPRDPEARRATLAAAAIEVIAEVGIGRTTHRAVAARAGLPLGATTYYFPTLDDLIAAGLRQATEDLQADLAGRAPVLRTADDLPRALTDLAFSYLEDRGKTQIEYELFVAAARDPALRPLAETWLTGMTDLLEPHVGRAKARMIVALLDGAMLHALVTASTLDRGALTSALNGLILS